MPTLLIADDEKNIRATLSRALRLEGYQTVEAENGAVALKVLEKGEVDLVILDLQMPELDGLGLLEAMAEKALEIPRIVLTAHGSIDRAVKAVRLGAFDFIEKPPAIERILVAVENALRVGNLERENRRLQSEAGLGGDILGDSPAMGRLADTVRKVAATDATVLLTGENGTGKELVARAIHEGSPRRRRPLVPVNCAAIPETLFESELFGHVKGAFTGATDSRRGKFQQADGGTLFLDEVGEVPLALQPKMLRALESREVERVGGQGVEKVDVRLIAATNRDLEREVKDGRFRDDLFFRLNVVPVRIPPLRERREDVPLLAKHFLDVACRRHGVSPKSIAPTAMDALVRHAWPGNVRELRNAMERVAILSAGASISSEDLAFLDGGPSPSGGVRAPAGAFSLSSEVERLEREIVVQVLDRNRGRMTRAAEELGLERSHLYKKLKALGIERKGEE